MKAISAGTSNQHKEDMDQEWGKTVTQGRHVKIKQVTDKTQTLTVAKFPDSKLSTYIVGAFDQLNNIV